MWAPQKAESNRAGKTSPVQAPRIFHPDFAGVVRYQSIERPADDEAATADTIAIMRQVVREDSQAPAIRAIAAAAGAGSDPLTGIHRWVRSHVRFREDAEPAKALHGFTGDTEVLIRPVDLVRMPQPAGDCDDFSMLTAALLRAVGIPAAFVTIAADPASPNTYSHVYVIAAGRIPMDTSHGRAPGWSAPAKGKSRRWEIDDVFTRATPAQLGDTAPAVWWQDIIKIGATAGADIARMAATPTGYYQQTGPGGQSITTRQSGVAPFSMPSIGTGNSTLLLMGGAAVLLILLVARK